MAVSAADVLGQITNATGSYKTAAILGMAGSCLADPIMAPASSGWLFRMWGKVTIIDADSFDLDDGVRVVAPGYSGIGNGDYVSVRGILEWSSTPQDSDRQGGACRLVTIPPAGPGARRLFCTIEETAGRRITLSQDRESP